MAAMRVITAAALSSTAMAVGVGNPQKTIYPVGQCSGAVASSPQSKTCCDVTELNNKKCHFNTKWAMEKGAKWHPDWYNIYDVYSNNTFFDFQCALFLIDFNAAEQAEQKGFPPKSHDCPRPCSTTLRGDCAKPGADLIPLTTTSTTPMMPACPLGVAPIVAPSCMCNSALVCSSGMCCSALSGCAPCAIAPPPTIFKVLTPAPTMAIALKEEKSSLETWMIILIAVLALLACLGCLFAAMHGGKGNKKKGPAKAKRTQPVPKTTPVPPPTPPPAPPASVYAQPQPVYTMQPQQVYAAPPPTTYVQPQPVYATTAQPQMMVQPQMQMVQPQMLDQRQMAIQTVATPLPVYSQSQPSLFDMIDRNGDGVISRNEMQMMHQR